MPNFDNYDYSNIRDQREGGEDFIHEQDEDFSRELGIFKCDYCGGYIHITDEYCPRCGIKL